MPGNLTFLRWIFFVIATLPTTISLMAMGGVPWTKAFGIMFLVSFVVIEIVVEFVGRIWLACIFPLHHKRSATIQKKKSMHFQTSLLLLPCAMLRSSFSFMSTKMKDLFISMSICSYVVYLTTRILLTLNSIDTNSI